MFDSGIVSYMCLPAECVLLQGLRMWAVLSEKVELAVERLEHPLVMYMSEPDYCGDGGWASRLRAGTKDALMQSLAYVSMPRMEWIEAGYFSGMVALREVHLDALRALPYMLFDCCPALDIVSVSSAKYANIPIFSNYSKPSQVTLYNFVNTPFKDLFRLSLTYEDSLDAYYTRKTDAAFAIQNPSKCCKVIVCDGNGTARLEWYRWVKSLVRCKTGVK